MKAGQDEFFSVVGEGAALLRNLDEQSSGFFDDLNRLREILAMLGFASAVKPLQFSLSDKAASLKALGDYLATGVKMLADELGLYELQTITELGQLVGSGGTLLPEALWDFQRTLKHKDNDEAAKRAVFDNIAARGVKHGFEQAELDNMLAASVAHLAKRPEENPEYAAAQDRYARIGRERTQMYDALSALILQGGLDGIDTSELKQKRTDMLETTGVEQTEAWLHLKELHEAYNTDRVEGDAAIFDGTGVAIIAKVAEASPVTPEQAQAWAAEQIIDDNAKAKLRKLGYKPDDVVRDMAEFYRLSGGKASAIRIGLDGGRRANAVGITERLGEKVINLGGRFNKTVLFHELAHHLENDPIAKAASNGFLLKRREGEGVYRLRDLTGNKGYDKSETAYKDHFMDAYVGKVYKDGVTEVFAMGVQYLANPKDAAIFAAKDPEMFAMITGYLTMQKTPAMAAKLDMHKSAIGEVIEKRQNEEIQYEKAVAYLADKGALTVDNWYEVIDPADDIHELITTYILYRVKKDKAVYVGSHGNYRVFSGLFRNSVTKRNGKGHVVIDIATGGIQSGYRNEVPQHEIVHGGLEVVQAVIAIAERDGAGLFNALRGYFVDSWTRDRKKKLIESVGRENLQ
ncbi:MAG: hypothetical protein WKG03_00670 [Telluria sp.]